MSEILTSAEVQSRLEELCDVDGVGKAKKAREVYDEIERLRLALAEATRERDEAIRTVKALTPAANYCLEYKPLLLKAERERDDAVRVLRDIATFGWYAKGAKVARAYLAAREGR